ncbi:hypothetical protein C2G38_2217889 [Gigaspora rosea]|uniref:Uncharacterized protein n=1 Tax=Gigaspora rosea TaxID=44941 RepID=A0A397UAL3_9GLOM|nr:hypothetical protein C2G38_2217889 [Gigaspora rosea]CAG8766438.1 9800_t:CDS:2 [Gigaspora rosea]
MCLFKALQTIALEGVLAEKAQSFLDVFDEYIRASTIRQFWESYKGHVRQDLLQENEVKSALKKQNMNELNQTPQQKKKRCYSPTCSEEYSSSDSEIVPVSLIRKILEESRNNEAIESEYVTHLSRAVKLETTELGPNNINEETELEPNNINEETELGPNEETELEPKKQKTKQYITRDLVKEVLEAYQTRVLPGEKLIYNGTNVLDFIYFLYKNDVLLQPMSEHELNTHIWTPLLRNAFLEKTDIKLSYGELASRSYNKLKEMLNVAGNSAPKLDGKGLLRSLGTEILAQEDGVLNTYGKRTGDLKKLEYCTKVLLTVLYFALPTTEKNDITEIETYSLQSNGFQLTISASKYLFENTIITVGLQDIEVRTVEGFSKLIKGIKIILSWKARTRKNTNKFYEVLKKGNERIKNGELFTPKRISVV